MKGSAIEILQSPGRAHRLFKIPFAAPEVVADGVGALTTSLWLSSGLVMSNWSWSSRLSSRCQIAPVRVRRSLEPLAVPFALASLARCLVGWSPPAAEILKTRQKVRDAASAARVTAYNIQDEDQGAQSISDIGASTRI